MTDYNKWKVTDLKLELKKRGLLQTGIKSHLIARLEEAESKGDSESEETTQNDSSKLDTASTNANSLDTVVSPPAFAGETETLQDSLTPSDSTVTELPHPDNITSTDAPTIPSAITPKENSNSVSNEVNDVPATDIPPAEETPEDPKNRKRALQSPASPSAETSPKRPRTNQDSVTNENKAEWDVKGSGHVNKNESEDEIKKDYDANHTHSLKTEHSEPEIDSKNPDVEEVTREEETNITDLHDSTMAEMSLDQENTTNSEPADSSVNTRLDSRFKGLFNAGENSNDADSTQDDAKPDRSVTPAIHPATAALYIRDMQRPLSPQQFRFHLSALAAPPGQDPDPDLILSFYLDPIRTHAFISFRSITAASRVRMALHSCIWPDERNRKPLWVDFVPEEKIEDWITQEQESNTGGRSMAKKWEVYYDIGEDRQITASLQEVSNVPMSAQHNSNTNSQSSNQIPLGPRTGIDGAPSGPRAHYPRAQLAPVDIGGSKLNELFNSTVTKPVLYWKPISKELANKRLDRIEDSYSSEVKAGGRVMGDPHRYTFEEGDLLVDRGVELVPGLRPPPGYRAPRPGGDRGGFTGGGWGRGGASRYRGRGGGGYRGMANEKYGYSYESRNTRDYGRY